MDYTSLTAAKTSPGSIQNWVNSNKVPADVVIGDAENWLEQNMRVTAMQKRHEFVLAEGLSEYDLATYVPDFLDPVILWSQALGDEVTYLPEFDIDRYRVTKADGSLLDGTPAHYALVGRETALFDMKADEACGHILTYYARPQALSASNQTNLYTRRFRALFRQVCLGMSYVFLKDFSRADSVLRTASVMIAQANENDDMARRGQRLDTSVYHGR